MLELKEWSKLPPLGYQTLAVDSLQSDCVDLIYYLQNNRPESLSSSPIYYWNLGSDRFDKVTFSSRENINFTSTKIRVDEDNLLSVLTDDENEGIFLIDDWLTDDLSSNILRKKESQLQNFIRKNNSSKTPKIVFFLIQDYPLSDKLSAILPVLKYSLPSAAEIHSLLVKKVAKFSPRHRELLDLDFARMSLLGLSRGSIRYALDLYCCSDQKFEDLIYNYKVAQFRELGLEFIAAPDLERAGGLDLLQEYFQVIAQLNDISAVNYGLSPPKGMLLLGVPGTGKTLCAKLAAKILGYSLMGFSWSNILGATNSDRALSTILEIADKIDFCVLLADDFDKGFTGWSDGGASMRLSQKLLTWMQEHTSRVLMIATVNRIGLLPPELKRRFDDGGIWFVDLPSMGEMQEIFKMYLAKYFPEQFSRDPWTPRQWYKLLKEYSGSTPIEIKNAIVRCATSKYCNLSSPDRAARTPITVSVEDLLAQLEQFVKSIDRDGEDLRGIRNSGSLFKRASSPDRSIFVREKQSMFDYQPHQLEA